MISSPSGGSVLAFHSEGADLYEIAKWAILSQSAGLDKRKTKNAS
jgi:hypothetical protein